MGEYLHLDNQAAILMGEAPQVAGQPGAKPAIHMQVQLVPRRCQTRSWRTIKRFGWMLASISRCSCSPGERSVKINKRGILNGST